MRRARKAASAVLFVTFSALIALLAVPTCFLAGLLTVLWRAADWTLARLGNI